jgi:hypothetical protein
MTDPQLPQNSGDPLPELPMPPKRPFKPGKPRSSPGLTNGIILGLSIVGMLVFSPVLAKLKQTDGEYLLTPSVIWHILGFFFSLLVFSAMVGVRAVFWIAETFVDFIFGVHGSNRWVEKSPRDQAEEEAEWYVRPPTPAPPAGGEPATEETAAEEVPPPISIPTHDPFYRDDDTPPAGSAPR